MLYLKRIPILYLLIHLIQSQQICPFNKGEVGSCSKPNACSNGYCMDLGSTHLCCEHVSYCNETGLKLFPMRGRTSVSVLWNDSFVSSAAWYKTSVSFGSEPRDLACPLPKPANIVENHPHATGFSVGERVPYCTKNSECKEDEFCGVASNPTNCRGQLCRDKSGENGNPLMFCFKLPDDHMIIDRDSTGLTFCHSDDDCTQMENSHCPKFKNFVVMLDEQETWISACLHSAKIETDNIWIIYIIVPIVILVVFAIVGGIVFCVLYKRGFKKKEHSNIARVIQVMDDAHDEKKQKVEHRLEPKKSDENENEKTEVLTEEDDDLDNMKKKQIGWAGNNGVSKVCEWNPEVHEFLQKRLDKVDQHLDTV